MTIIGIDPGWGGGFAFSSPDGRVWVEKMPATELGINELLRPLAGKAKAGLELVHAMGGNGSIANFKLGTNWGALRAALSTLNIPWLQIPPTVWMKRLQPLPVGAGAKRTERKKAIKELMKQRYPELGRKITNDTADALAILEYMIVETTKDSGWKYQ